jgi:hypothetical protein
MSWRNDLLQAECDDSPRRRQKADLLLRVRKLAAHTTIADESYIAATLASATELLEQEDDGSKHINCGAVCRLRGPEYLPPDLAVLARRLGMYSSAEIEEWEKAKRPAG